MVQIWWLFSLVAHSQFHYVGAMQLDSSADNEVRNAHYETKMARLRYRRVALYDSCAVL